MSVNDSAILTHEARIGIQCNYYVFKLFIHPPSLDEIVNNLCLVHIFFMLVEALEVSTSYKVLVTRGCVMVLVQGHIGKCKVTGGKNAEFLSRPYLV